MMDWSDRHCRYFHRLFAPHALLYTEMIVSAAIVRGNAARLLEFDPSEHPVALQLGGCDPQELARAARIGAAMGYDEINLNVGCPSDRVSSGAFGACLMLQPELVGDCVRAMREAVDVPVTVKCRIGINEQDSYDFFARFVDTVAAAGVDALIVHARAAILGGLVAGAAHIGRAGSGDGHAGLTERSQASLGPLDHVPPRSGVVSEGLGRPGLERPQLTHPGLEHPGLEHPGLERPGLTRPGLERPGLGRPRLTRPGAGRPRLTPKENREIPPLKYHYVHRLQAERPEMPLVINGGFTAATAVADQSVRGLGVMLGRAAYHNPRLLAELERTLIDPAWSVPEPRDIIERMVSYAGVQAARGVRLHSITRHMHGLMAGREGARAWRRFLSEVAARPGAPPETLFSAIPLLNEGLAA
jgi:tRNA-dihydrouridine synthase